MSLFPNCEQGQSKIWRVISMIQVTQAQNKILEQLKIRDMTIKDIADWFQKDLGYISKKVKELEKKGLVKRMQYKASETAHASMIQIIKEKIAEIEVVGNLPNNLPKTKHSNLPKSLPEVDNENDDSEFDEDIDEKISSENIEGNLPNNSLSNLPIKKIDQIISPQDLESNLIKQFKIPFIVKRVEFYAYLDNHTEIPANVRYFLNRMRRERSAFTAYYEIIRGGN
jgi:DNA-binding MarR family transcriptional regulator